MRFPLSVLFIISLLSNLSASDEVKNRALVDTLTARSWQAFSYDLDSALNLALKALELSKKIEYENGLSNAHSRLGVIYKYRNEASMSKKHHLACLLVRLRIGDSSDIANTLTNLSSTYSYLGSYDSAFHYLFESRYIRQGMGDSAGLIKTMSSLGNLYLDQGEFKQASRCYKRQKSLLTFMKYPLSGRYYNNIGNLFYKKEQSDSALKYFSKAVTLYRSSGYPYKEAAALNHVASCYMDLELYQEAICSFDSSLRVSSGLGDSTLVHEIKINRLLCLLKINPEQCKKEAKLVEAFADSLHSERIKSTAYWTLSEYYRLNGLFEESLSHYKTHMGIEKELFNAEKESIIQEAQAKYDKVQLRVQKDELEKQAKNTMIAAISLLALLVVSVLITLLFRQRLKARTALAAKNQELHLQKLDELAKERQLEKITALMEGQEQERKRISGELHDGLGSLLATIKHHFEVVEDKIHTNHEAYEKAYGLLDRASEEVRRISHNMASNILSKFGLVAALQDLAEMVNASNQVQFELSISGLEGRLENSKEIHLFRICQELVSNALKHAEAKTISLQITMRDNELSLIVEDDGKGFEQEKAALAEGMGLSNLRARIDHLEGSIDIDSTLGRGTTVVIEVPL